MKIFLLSILSIALAVLGFAGLQYIPDWATGRVDAKFGAGDDEFVVVGEDRVHILEQGDPNGAPVVLLHGMNSLSNVSACGTDLRFS